MAKKETRKKKDKSSSEGTYKGVLDITRSGMGYVIVENLQTDILIRPNDFNTAMHGDKVRVKIVSESGKSGRKQGQVTEVLQRKQTEFQGRIDISKNFAFFIAETEHALNHWDHNNPDIQPGSYVVNCKIRLSLTLQFTNQVA